MFWPLTFWINCSIDLKNFGNSWPRISKVDHFFLIEGQNNFWNKIPFLHDKIVKKYKEKTKMEDNYFLSLSFWLIFHPLWSSGLKCSSKLKMWHLYISRFSTIKRCGFNGFTAENQCFKVIPPVKHIGTQLYNFVPKSKARDLKLVHCIRVPSKSQNQIIWL